jgi:hypothetical protein
MFGLILSIALSFNVNIDSVKSYVNNNDYEAAIALLNDIKVTPANYNDYYYYSLLCDFRLNNKLLVLWHLRHLDDSFYPFTRRQTAIISLIREEVTKWKDNDLNDIMRDMNKSSDKLISGKIDTSVKATQKQIIDKLQRYIDELEDPPSKDPNSNEPKGNKDGQEKSGQQKQDPTQGNNPLEDSKIGGVSGKGSLVEKKLRQVTESWGSLPPQERAKVVVEITKEVPAKYKDLVDAYFKSLTKYRP